MPRGPRRRQCSTSIKVFGLCVSCLKWRTHLPSWDSGTLFGVSQSLILYELSPFEDFFLQGASTISFIIIPMDVLIDVAEALAIRFLV
jgi:hypothetical protein